MTQAIEFRPEGWKAELNMQFQHRFNKTVISKLDHFGPLRIQRPFYPEGATSHVYLLHPPGGVVGGDSIEINLRSEKKSHALITTPGAAKFYRSAGSTAFVRQNLVLEDQSRLEWFPQENIFFPGARVNSRTRIDLKGSASFIGWEINCLGRPVNGEIFNEGYFNGGLDLYRDGFPLLLEKQRVSSLYDLNAGCGLRNYPVQGIFLATHVDEKLLESCRTSIDGYLDREEKQNPLALTLLGDLLVLRVLSTRTARVQKIMFELWQIVRETIMGKAAVAPRIWAT